MSNRKILIADDDQDLAEVLAIRCQCLGFQPVVAYDGESALELAAQWAPCAIIMDITMPGNDGVKTCQMMDQFRELRDVPIVFHSGMEAANSSKEVYSLGGLFVKKGPNSWREIESLLALLVGDEEEGDQSTKMPSNDEPHVETSLLDKTREKQMQQNLGRFRVLSIEDSQEYGLILATRLEQLGFEVSNAGTCAAGIQQAIEMLPDVILLDHDLPDGTAGDVLTRLSEIEETRAIPVIVVTSHKEQSLARAMRQRGVIEVFSKPNLKWDRLGNAISTVAHLMT